MSFDAEKKPCHACGVEGTWRCTIHPERVAHRSWHLTQVCHECDAVITTFIRAGYDSRTAELKLLESRFILCPSCAHEQALFEDAERELENFLGQAPRFEDLEERLV